MGRTFRAHPSFETDDASPFEFHRNMGFTNRFTPGGGYGAAQGHNYTLRLRNNETIETCQRQFRKRPVTPCPCCFQVYGKIWQLKGKGHKSRNKNKGMRRELQRDNSLSESALQPTHSALIAVALRV